jgi:predicted small metal-binding protein
MLKVSCADLGESCRWEATAESGEELKKLVWQHARRSHKQLFKTMSEADRAELEARIDALIEMQGG